MWRKAIFFVNNVRAALPPLPESGPLVVGPIVPAMCAIGATRLPSVCALTRPTPSPPKLLLPPQRSPQYTQPVRIDAGLTTVRATLFVGDKPASAVSSVTYNVCCCS